MILDVAVPQFVADGEGQRTGAEPPLLRLVHRRTLPSTGLQEFSATREFDDIVWEYGADALRLYELFMGP
jgi:hypothetical protein